MCQQFIKKRKHCTKGELCAFVHQPSEQRDPANVCDKVFLFEVCKERLLKHLEDGGRRRKGTGTKDLEGKQLDGKLYGQDEVEDYVKIIAECKPQKGAQQQFELGSMFGQKNGADAKGKHAAEGTTVRRLRLSEMAAIDSSGAKYALSAGITTAVPQLQSWHYSFVIPPLPESEEKVDASEQFAEGG